MIHTQTRKNAFTRHQKVKHIFLFCHNFKTYVQKWVSITLNTSMYNKPRANYNRRKVLHTPSIIYSRGFLILCKKKNIFGWAGVKGLLLRAEGGQLKARHTATSVSQVGWAGVKRLLLRAEGGQFYTRHIATSVSLEFHHLILEKLL